ncbi:MAG TPA: hypothetical protein VGL72_16980 [Bryobacteraceae bacterium]|jgi:hypothetical protein
MNYHHISKTLRALFATLFVTGLVAHAQAGPGVHESFLPVKTMKEAEAIKPGTRIAISCGNCGVTSIFVAGSDRSYLHGFTCEHCKKKFVARMIGGHGSVIPTYFYEDDAGHHSTLLRAM